MLLHFETPCPSFGPPGRGMPGTPGHCPSLPTDVDVTKCYLQHGGGNAVHRPPGYLAQLCTVKVVHRRASILDRTNHYTNIGHCHRTYWTSCLMVKLLCVKACCVLCTRTVGLYRCWNGRRCRYARKLQQPGSCSKACCKFHETNNLPVPGPVLECSVASELGEC